MVNKSELNAERKEAWFRLLVAIVSGVILYFWRVLICVIAIIHWIYVVFTGKKVRDLAEFSEYFNTELYKFTRYLTFVTNERPFPFSSIERISKFEK